MYLHSVIAFLEITLLSVEFLVKEMSTFLISVELKLDIINVFNELSSPIILPPVEIKLTALSVYCKHLFKFGAKSFPIVIQYSLLFFIKVTIAIIVSELIIGIYVMSFDA